MRFLIILILSLIALGLNAQIIKSNAIMELNNMDFSTPCTSCSEWRYSRNTNFLYRWNGTSWIIYNPGSTLNLGLSMPGIFNVSPSTLTGSGTFNVTLNSQAQNTFLAAPSNASGVPTFRTLTPSDLSVAGGLSGTSSAGRVAFYTGTSTLTGDANLTWDNSDKSLSLGGSGVSSSLLTLNSTTRGILIPRMTTTEKNAIVAPATGLLVYDLTLGAFNVYNGSSWVSVGGGLPAGSNGQIQFNNNNVFGASSNLFWDNANGRLGIRANPPDNIFHLIGNDNVSRFVNIENSSRNGRFFIEARGAFGIEINDTGSPTARFSFDGQNPLFTIGRSGAITSFQTINSATEFRLWNSGTINKIRISSIGDNILEGATNLIFSTSGSVGSMTERMRINSSGNATLGTTTTAGARLHIAGSGSDNNASSLLIQNSLARTLFSVRNDGLAQLGRNTAVTTQEVAQIQVVSDDTNTGLVLTPKGTGAIIAGPAPDGGSTGGNARGPWAVDLQMIRDVNTHVASGSRSVIGGGENNRALGAIAVVSGGSGNEVSSTSFGGFAGGGQSNITEATVAAVVGGLQGRAYLRGQSAYSTGMFSSIGDAQFSQFNTRRLVTGQNQTELFLDGSSEKAILRATNRVWNASIQCTGVVSVAGNGTVVAGDALVQTFNLGIKRIGTSTTIMGNNSSTQFSAGDTNMAGANFTVDADDANEALRIQFTPPTAAGTTTVTRCHCTVRLNEVGF